MKDVYAYVCVETMIDREKGGRKVNTYQTNRSETERKIRLNNVYNFIRH